jgi:hypothetical protein
LGEFTHLTAELGVAPDRQTVLSNGTINRRRVNLNVRGSETVALLALPFDPRSFPWPRDWQAIPPGFEQESANAMGYMETLGTDEVPATNFVAELRREMCSDHPLFHRRFVAIACSAIDPDDVLFFTNDPEEPFAFVHLTWHIERTASFPWCQTFATVDSFLNYCSAGN